MKKIIATIVVTFIIAGCATANSAGKAAQSEKKENKSGFSIDLETVEGSNFSFEDIRDKKHLVLAFWATWCEPCKEELMQLAKMYEEFSDEFEFAAVSTDGEDLMDKVSEFAAENAFPFPILVDPSGNFVSSMIPGGDTVPYTIVVLKDGSIHSKHSGYKPGDEITFKKELQKLLKKEK